MAASTVRTMNITLLFSISTAAVSTKKIYSAARKDNKRLYEERLSRRPSLLSSKWCSIFQSQCTNLPNRFVQ